MSVGGASRTLAKLRELLDDDLFLRTNRGWFPRRALVNSMAVLLNFLLITAGFLRRKFSGQVMCVEFFEFYA